MPPVILASGSPYRKELLQRVFSDFQCMAPNLDEESLKSSGLEPDRIAQHLARAKAEAVAANHADAIVIGSDQVADLDGQLLGKPHTVEQACLQLSLMSGSEHRLITAVCLCFQQHRVEFSCVTTLRMRSLTADEILRYVQRDQPLDCAGSYRIEAAGIGLFERIQTDDFTSIIGLPLIQLVTELRNLGVRIP
ncbi:MAG: septum formation protein Maf [Planctomycetaceae bacterium]|nr:septum formation protein Maf [Planctomycetaceae bacterium]